MAQAVRFASKLKELRIHLCQTGSASKGVRDFIEKYYIPIKTNNPNIPILVRECAGIQPRMWARYELGKETSIPLTNLNADDVLQKMKNLNQ